MDDNANDLLTARDAVKKFYNLVQGRAVPNDVYMERFKESWKQLLIQRVVLRA